MPDASSIGLWCPDRVTAPSSRLRHGTPTGSGQGIARGIRLCPGAPCAKPMAVFPLWHGCLGSFRGGSHEAGHSPRPRCPARGVVTGACAAEQVLCAPGCRQVDRRAHAGGARRRRQPDVLARRDRAWRSDVRQRRLRQAGRRAGQVLGRHSRHDGAVAEADADGARSRRRRVAKPADRYLLPPHPVGPTGGARARGVGGRVHGNRRARGDSGRRNLRLPPGSRRRVDVGASRSFVPGFAFNHDTGTFWHGTHVAGIVAARPTASASSASRQKPPSSASRSCTTAADRSDGSSRASCMRRLP